MSISPSDLDADWQRLWALAERLTSPVGADPAYAFLPLGLRLHRPDPQGRWDSGDRSTPANSVTFASTGGNGVHFGILHDRTAGGTAPIIMTVPMASDSPHHIVGASLREFLALGCRTGYYHMEQLAYFGGRQEEIAWLERGQWPMGMAGWDGPGQGIDPVELLEALGQEFALAPWPKVEQRLGELQTGYLPASHPPQS